MKSTSTYEYIEHFFLLLLISLQQVLLCPISMQQTIQCRMLSFLLHAAIKFFFGWNGIPPKSHCTHRICASSPLLYSVSVSFMQRLVQTRFTLKYTANAEHTCTATDIYRRRSFRRRVFDLFLLSPIYRNKTVVYTYLYTLFISRLFGCEHSYALVR